MARAELIHFRLSDAPGEKSDLARLVAERIGQQNQRIAQCRHPNFDMRGYLGPLHFAWCRDCGSAIVWDDPPGTPDARRGAH